MFLQKYLHRKLGCIQLKASIDVETRCHSQAKILNNQCQVKKLFNVFFMTRDCLREELLLLLLGIEECLLVFIFFIQGEAYILVVFLTIKIYT